MNVDPEKLRSEADDIRRTTINAINHAGGGHYGGSLSISEILACLYFGVMNVDPDNPEDPGRDRFVLSPGHASMLLYSLLHLTGYDLALEELKSFRQWGSMTPGHPELRHTPGVEVTTGPLGQGFAHGIGMAIAERWLAEHYNKPGHEIINHFIYAIVSDGDMQEGVTSEAASLAGTLGLGNLIYLYDDNDIQIEGTTEAVFGENVARRFDAYGWNVIGPIDGHAISAIEQAISEAQEDTQRPTLIICKTIIGYGSPDQATAKAHNDPLGEEAVRATKEAFNWPLDPEFYIPEEVLVHMRKAIDRGEDNERNWSKLFEAYRQDYPELAQRLLHDLSGELPDDWDSGLDELFKADHKPIATRNASGEVLNQLVDRIHSLTGGSADLSPSTKTTLAGYGDFGWHEYCGHNLHFGVREHAMGAIVGGMALHGGLIPYAATFLTFSDYMRPPMRLAALMGIRVIYIFTHDSIGVGEDGPTHQPIEHIANLRAVPNLTVVRPSDATETVEAWRAALMNRSGPTAMLLTRQNLPVLDRDTYAAAENLQYGAYVLWQSKEGDPDLIIIGTGSELHAALEAGKQLAHEGVNVRVVSMPSWELFEAQSEEYREQILPGNVRSRLAVEAGTSFGWERYVGLDGEIIAIDHFGASAPAPILFEKFGLMPEQITGRAREMLLERSEV